MTSHHPVEVVVPQPGAAGQRKRSSGGPTVQYGDTKPLDYSKPHYRDVWAGVAFVAQLALFIYFGIVEIISFLESDKFSNSGGASQMDSLGCQSTDCERNVIVISLACGGFGGILLAFFWIGVMKRYGGGIIQCMLLSTIGLFVIQGIVLLASVGLLSGLLMLLFAGLMAWFYTSVRHRIPFAQVCIEIATQAIQNYSAPVYISFVVAIIQIVYQAFFVLVLASLVSSEQLSRGTLFLTLLSFFWTMQTLSYIVHVTTSGTVATWLFFAEPKNPTSASLKRTMTTSFGSVCLGSLLIALVKAVEAMLRSNENTDNFCIRFLMDCFRQIMEFITKYAFVEVALYGKSFFTAAHDTWDLFKQKGVTVLVNDVLVGYVLMAGALFGALICALIAWVATSLFTSSSSTALLWIVILSAVLGAFVVGLTMSVIDSAIATVLVVFVEDPAARAMLFMEVASLPLIVCLAVHQVRPEQFAKFGQASEIILAREGSGFQ